MDSPADVHADSAVQLSDDGLERPADERSTHGSMSGASTDAYESDDDLEVTLSDDDGGSGDTSLEDALGEESAQILRLTVLYTREVRTEIANAQALLNRLRTRLVRHSYGRNTCNKEDYFYSLYLSCQTKLENKKEALRTVEIRLDEIRSILALQGIDLE